jgi:hypothetical protein
MSSSAENRAETNTLTPEEILENKARNLIQPILQATGPIQYIDLINKISYVLGYKDEVRAPTPILYAVENAWHEREFTMAGDRTVTINEKPRKQSKR